MKMITALICFTLISLLPARELYVDYAKGRSTNPGTDAAPFSRFAQALKVVQPGDVIKIKPFGKPIQDTIAVINLRGQEGKPIVIDGMNNIFTGAKPLNPKDWQEVSPRLYRCTRHGFHHDAIRYFMIHGNTCQRMGRYTKSKGSQAFKAVEALQPGEWTIVDKDPGNKQKHTIEYYVKLAAEDKSLAEGNWGETSRFCGVQVKTICSPDVCGAKGNKGSCSTIHSEYITIRNIIVTHFLNDGFNIHGNAKHIRFENVAAIECGDDGFSAHDYTEVALENFLSIRNSTVISHINDAKTTHKNVYGEGTLGIDFFPCESTDTTLEDAWFNSSSYDGIRINNHKGGQCRMKNVVCLSGNPKARFDCALNAKNQPAGTFENVRIAGYDYKGKLSGVAVEANPADLQKIMAEKRKAFFALFGGQLEKLGL